MADFKDVLLEYLHANKDNKKFEVDFTVFKDFSYEDVATMFEELISTGKIDGFVDYQHYQPEVFIEKINWNHFQHHLK